MISAVFQGITLFDMNDLCCVPGHHIIIHDFCCVPGHHIIIHDFCCVPGHHIIWHEWFLLCSRAPRAQLGGSGWGGSRDPRDFPACRLSICGGTPRRTGRHLGLVSFIFTLLVLQSSVGETMPAMVESWQLDASKDMEIRVMLGQGWDCRRQGSSPSSQGPAVGNRQRSTAGLTPTGPDLRVTCHLCGCARLVYHYWCSISDLLETAIQNTIYSDVIGSSCGTVVKPLTQGKQCCISLLAHVKDLLVFASEMIFNHQYSFAFSYLKGLVIIGFYYVNALVLWGSKFLNPCACWMGLDNLNSRSRYGFLSWLRLIAAIK